MKIKAKYKIARRLGAQVFEKTQLPKFALSEARRGRKEAKHPRQKTDYGLQMLEKQRVRYTYVIGERQFVKYVRESMAKKGVKPTIALYERLESRLDNVVAKLGFSPTRLGARQMVSHGHIKVNGKRVTIPSFEVSLGDKITIREQSLPKPLFKDLNERLKDITPPSWMKFDFEKKEGVMQGAPKMETTGFQNNLSAVIEFYSR